MIGDIDPEDAYDADDPPHVRLKVLEEVVASLVDDDVRRETRRVDALRVVVNLAVTLHSLQDRLDAIRQALEEL